MMKQEERWVEKEKKVWNNLAKNFKLGKKKKKCGIVETLKGW